MSSKQYKIGATLTTVLVWILLITAWVTKYNVLEFYFGSLIASILTVTFLTLYRFYHPQDYKSRFVWRLLCILLGTPLTLIIVVAVLILAYDGKGC